MRRLVKLVNFEKYKLGRLGRGKTKGIKISDINDKKNDFLHEGHMELNGFIQISTCVQSTEELVCGDSIEKKKEHQFALLTSLSDSFSFANLNQEENYNRFSDFEITCSSGEVSRTFPVHKLILSLGSPVFMAMLKNDYSESSSNSMDITDIHPNTMQNIIEYLYKIMLIQRMLTALFLLLPTNIR